MASVLERGPIFHLGPQRAPFVRMLAWQPPTQKCMLAPAGEIKLKLAGFDRCELGKVLKTREGGSSHQCVTHWFV
jgi:hypothetical protein